MPGKRSDVSEHLEEVRNLRFLEELEKNPIVSQRRLSQKFGIALGLTNSCLRRMAQKGWIRIRVVNRRRLGYYLTSRGLTEKAKLTFNHISSNVQRYSELKSMIHQKFLDMQRKGRKRIVFYGVSDEMEVAYITLQGVNLNLVGIVEDDERFQPGIILGYELEPVSRIHELKPEGILITSIEDTDRRWEKLRSFLDLKKLSVHDICV